MCGIAGYFKTDQKVSPSLTGAIEKLVHRGPDDSGIFTHGEMAMGQTRLSIIDLEGGHQPLFSENGDLALVANGEIYNFVELRKELQSRGHRFLTRSDCEVIIHCYAEYGDRFLEYLNGMFAFALYDKLEDRLLLARDRLGIKPLFISQSAGGVVFASEIKALLPLMDRKPAVNPVGLAQYLQNQFAAGATTILEGVQRIMPGEVVVIQKGQIADRRTYWSPLQIEPRTIEYAEAEAEFDKIMDTVMTEHMRSDVPFGLFLSGGVDSAVLLALLSRLKDEPVRTFSVGFPGTSLANELPAARAMAKRFGSSHEEVIPTVHDVYGVLPLTVWAADDLMRDYANMPTCLLAASAARELKVVFSGEGGDEVFAGYGRYRAPWLERFAKSLLAPGTGGFRSRGTFRGIWLKKLFRTQIRQSIRDHLKPFIDARSRTPGTWPDLMRMQYTDLVTAIPDNLLVKNDRMTMAWGLEGRVPFLDHRIVEFGLSLPNNLKIQSGEGKVFLKRWASKYIPEDYLRKPKKGFHVPMGEWLSRPFLEELQKILPTHPSVKPWFKPAGILELIKRSPDSPVNTRMLWAILQFAIWHKMFIESRGERPETFEDPIAFLR